MGNLGENPAKNSSETTKGKNPEAEGQKHIAAQMGDLRLFEHQLSEQKSLTDVKKEIPGAVEKALKQREAEIVNKIYANCAGDQKLDALTQEKIRPALLAGFWYDKGFRQADGHTVLDLENGAGEKYKNADGSEGLYIYWMKPEIPKVEQKIQREEPKTEPVVAAAELEKYDSQGKAYFVENSSKLDQKRSELFKIAQEWGKDAHTDDEKITIVQKLLELTELRYPGTTNTVDLGLYIVEGLGDFFGIAKKGKFELAEIQPIIELAEQRGVLPRATKADIEAYKKSIGMQVSKNDIESGAGEAG